MLARTATDPAIAALHDLRVARRKRRIADLHFVDTMYRLYVLVVVLAAALYWLSSALGRSTPSRSMAARIDRDAVWIAAVSLGLLLLTAVRSGKRGGPLASEGADVVHVLSAPIDRQLVLLRPFLAVLRRGTLVGGAAGVFVGEVLASLLPGSRSGWLSKGALLGAFVGLAWMSCAIASAGRPGVRRVIGVVVGLLTVGAAAEGLASRAAATRFTVTPLSALVWAPLSGSVADALNLRSSGWSVIIGALSGVALIIVVTTIARRGLGDVDMERAAHRARLVGQLRFAVSTQDLRTVLLLRRQLSSESSRRQPWFRVTQPRRTGLTAAVVVRSLRGIARWPLTRVARVVVLGLLSGAMAVVGWHNSVVLLCGCGVLAFVAGLDVVEAIGQHVDRPYIAAGMPRHRGRVMNRQVIVPSVVLFVLGFPGAVLVVLARWNGGSIAGAAIICLVCWSIGGAIGGAVSTVVGPPDFALSIQSPEAAMLMTVSPMLLSALIVSGPIISAHLISDPRSVAGGFTRALPPVALLAYLGTVVITAKGEPLSR